MKKILLLTVCSALSLSVFSTGFTLKNSGEQNPLNDHAVIVSTPSEKDVKFSDNLAQHGYSLVKQMDTLAKSDTYCNAVSVSDEINSIIKKIRETDYNAPKAVYKAAVPYGNATALSGASIKDFPENVRDLVESKFVSTIASQINATNGAETLAATSGLTSSDVLAAEDVKETTIYVYVFDGGCSAMVTFIPNEDNLVTSYASFVKSEDLSKVKSANELSKFVADNTDLNLEFTEVK